jgi:hypothetical protein
MQFLESWPFHYTAHVPPEPGAQVDYHLRVGSVGKLEIGGLLAVSFVAEFTRHWQAYRECFLRVPGGGNTSQMSIAQRLGGLLRYYCRAA